MKKQADSLRAPKSTGANIRTSQTRRCRSKAEVRERVIQQNRNGIQASGCNSIVR